MQIMQDYASSIVDAIIRGGRSTVALAAENRLDIIYGRSQKQMTLKSTAEQVTAPLDRPQHWPPRPAVTQARR
jgi:hypothetical protein